MAAAADLSAPVISAPFGYNWTGFFIGGSLGGVWATGAVTDSLLGLAANTRQSGFVGGGQSGFNYQFKSLVLGVEGSADWTSSSGTRIGGGISGGGIPKWVSTLAGRFGVAFDRVLLYAKAGAGWVENNAIVTNLTTGLSRGISNTSSGSLLGAGIEWAFWPNWSTKVEYNYLGTRSWVFTSPILPADTFTLSRNIQTAKVSLNYKFDWGNPITTRY
jgi:outer membrane immunogenic protein